MVLSAEKDFPDSLAHRHGLDWTDGERERTRNAPKANPNGASGMDGWRKELNLGLPVNSLFLLASSEIATISARIAPKMVSFLLGIQYRGHERLLS